MRQKKSKNETSAMSTKTENRPKQARKNGGSKHLKSRPYKQRLSAGPGHYFIWGYHAVCAALSNPNRIVKRFYASPTSKELAIELAQNAACRTASKYLRLTYKNNYDFAIFEIGSTSPRQNVDSQSDNYFVRINMALVILDF